MMKYRWASGLGGLSLRFAGLGFAGLGILSLVLISFSTFAHGDVKNEAVKARKAVMKDIGANMKMLSAMAKGEVGFNKAKARAITADMAELSAKVPGLFRAEETDSASKAKPGIWRNFDDFTMKSKELESISRGLSKSIAGLDDVKAGVGALGANCKACHQVYQK